MWEEVLTVVNSETGGDDARLFVQEENWDGTQYLRSASHSSICVHVPRVYLTCAATTIYAVQCSSDSHSRICCLELQAVSLAAVLAESQTGLSDLLCVYSSELQGGIG